MPQTFDSRTGKPTAADLFGIVEANPLLLQGKKISRGVEALQRRTDEGTLDTKKGRKLQKNLSKRLRKRGQALFKTGTRDFAKDELGAQLGEVGDLRQRAGGLADKNIMNVDNQARRETQVLGANTAAQAAQAMQQGAGPQAGFGAQLGDALRIAKARAGITARGDAAIRNQQLKDRMKIAGQGIDLRGTALRSLAEARHIRQGLNVGLRDIKNQSAQANADALGGLAGAASAAFVNYRKNNPKAPTPASTTPTPRG